MLEHVHSYVIALVVAVLCFLFIEAGFRSGRFRKASAHSDAEFGVAQAAAFGLVALLLGFSYSIALSRFDDRRAVTVREANAIGTTILRTDLFDKSTAIIMRGYLKRYIDARVDFAEADTDATRQARAAQLSDSLQRQMWDLAMSTSRRDEHSTMIPLFIATLNETIDISTEQTAVLNAHIPDLVIAVLVFVILVACSMLGYGFGRETFRALIASVVFSAMFGIVIGTILDLDRPQQGLVRIPLDSLRALQRSF